MKNVKFKKTFMFVMTSVLILSLSVFAFADYSVPTQNKCNCGSWCNKVYTIRDDGTHYWVVVCPDCSEIMISNGGVTGHQNDDINWTKVCPGCAELQGVEYVGIKEPLKVGSVTAVITDAFGGLLRGLAPSVVNTFDIYIYNDGKLTNLASWSLTFLGVGLAVGIVVWLRRKG